MNLKAIDLKITLLIFISLTLIVGSILYTIEAKDLGIKVTTHEKKEVQTLDIYEKIILDEYMDVINDLEFITKYVEQSIEGDTKDEIASNIKDFADTKKRYDQIRVLDYNGVETIRVNYKETGSVVVAEDKLQDKSSRDYYINAKNLSFHDIYISSLNLNIENGQVEVPYKPVIRFVRKTDVGEGYIVLNYLAQELFAHMDDYVDNRSREMYILYDDDQFHVLENGELVYLESSKKEFKFQNQYPEIWANRKKTHHVKTESEWFFLKSMSFEKIEFVGGNIITQSKEGWLVSVLTDNESELSFIDITQFDILKSVMIKSRFMIILFILVALAVGYIRGQKELQNAYINRALKFTAQLEMDYENRDFLSTLVEFLANEFSVKYVLVDQILENEIMMAKSVILHAEGRIIENVEYDLMNTPCENVFNKGLCCYKSQIQKLFPEDKMLVDMNAESYIGIPLFNATGKAIGIIAMIDDKKLNNPKIMEMVLQVVAVRASQDLERREHESVLKNSLALTQNIIDATEEGVIVFDEHMTYMEWNSIIANWTETPRESVIGKTVTEVFPDLTGTELLRVIINATHGESTIGREYKYISPSGTEYWFRDNTKPLVKEGKTKGAIKTLTNITEYKEKEEQLAISLQKEEIANEAKTRFLANMSHELRTPMNGMIGMIELTLMTELDEEQKEQLEIAKKSARILINILDDILHFSKIDSNHMVLKPTYVNLREVMHEVIDLFKPLADAKGLKLIGHVSDELPAMIYVDEKRLKQIGANLLGNAVKFTEQGSINLSIQVMDKSSEDVTLRFSCKDTGIGISQDNIQQIFNRFTQVDDSKARYQGGTGLGLSIVKSMVELMKGELWCESTLGKGSTFFFDLPLQYKEVLEENIQISDEYVSINEKRAILRILIVDDDSVNGKLLKAFLERQRHICFNASSGIEAVRLHKLEKPDLILMDINMPKMDGVEAMRLIRGNSVEGKEVIIAQTAHAFDEDKKMILNEGFDGYISKPIDFVELERVIQSSL